MSDTIPEPLSWRQPWRLLTEREHRWRLLWIFALFIPYAVVGTLAHEAGHYTVARSLGHEATLAYGWVYTDSLPEDREILREAYAWKRSHPGEAFPREAEAKEADERNELWISAGGPLQNVIFGTLGLIWLVALSGEGRRRWPGWAATFTALFWSRQPFVLLACALGSLAGVPPMEDSARVAISLGWWPWSLLLSTGVVGFGVCVAVIALQPAERRLHVLVGGPAGCVVGVVLWYAWLGPLLLPVPL